MSRSMKSSVSGKLDLKDDFQMFSLSLSKLGLNQLKVDKIEAGEMRDCIHETKRKLSSDIKDIVKEKWQWTLKVSVYSKCVQTVKDSIQEIEDEMEEIRKDLDEVKLQEVRIMQTP